MRCTFRLFGINAFVFSVEKKNCYIMESVLHVSDSHKTYITTTLAMASGHTFAIVRCPRKNERMPLNGKMENKEYNKTITNVPKSRNLLSWSILFEFISLRRICTGKKNHFRTNIFTRTHTHRWPCVERERANDTVDRHKLVLAYTGNIIKISIDHALTSNWFIRLLRFSMRRQLSIDRCTEPRESRTHTR